MSKLFVAMVMAIGYLFVGQVSQANAMGNASPHTGPNGGVPADGNPVGFPNPHGNPGGGVPADGNPVGFPNAHGKPPTF
jgi:hypothetical protein